MGELEQHDLVPLDHHVAADVDPVLEVDQLDAFSRHSESKNRIFEFIHSSGVIVLRFVESASVKFPDPARRRITSTPA
jgi:hypothetical protein